jgi:hypothetical protein
MVSPAELKRWNPAMVEEVFLTVRQRQQVLISSGDDFLSALPVQGW